MRAFHYSSIYARLIARLVHEQKPTHLPVSQINVQRVINFFATYPTNVALDYFTSFFHTESCSRIYLIIFSYKMSFSVISHTTISHIFSIILNIYSLLLLCRCADQDMRCRRSIDFNIDMLMDASCGNEYCFIISWLNFHLFHDPNKW